MWDLLEDLLDMYVDIHGKDKEEGIKEEGIKEEGIKDSTPIALEWP